MTYWAPLAFAALLLTAVVDANAANNLDVNQEHDRTSQNQESVAPTGVVVSSRQLA